MPEASDPPPADARPDAEVLADLGLPDPDTLKPGDDFSAFMSKAVPTRLRNRALRKLWLSNPVLANLDELVEYGEDYTDAATVIENLQTAYQVGRGWADKIIETPKPLLEKPADDEPDPPDEETLVEGGESIETEGSSEQLDPPEPVAPQAAEMPGEAAPPMSRKRMRFRVAED